MSEVVKALRSGDLDAKTCIDRVGKARIPRKDEVLLNYVVNNLKSKSDVSILWDVLGRLLASDISSEKIVILLRKTDVVSAFENALLVGHDTFRLLMQNRRYLKAIACSVEACMRLLQTALRSKVPDEVLRTILDFILFNAQYKFTIKKLNDAIADSSIASAIERIPADFLAAVYFPHIVLQDNTVKSFSTALESLTSLSDHVCTIQVPLYAISQVDVKKGQLLALTTLDHYLRYVSAAEIRVILESVKTSMTSIPARFLTSSSTCQAGLQQVYRALERDQLSPDTISLILSIDLDAIIPHIAAVMRVIAGDEDTTRLEVELYNVYVTIRNVESFYKHVIGIKRPGPINTALVAAIAENTTKLTDTVQRDHLSMMLQNDAMSIEVLLGIVKGMPMHSSALAEASERIIEICTPATDARQAALHSALAMNQKMSLPAEITSHFDSIRTALRQVELGHKPDSNLAKALLRVDRIHHPELLDRWLHVLAPILSSKQVKSIVSKLDNLHHPELLESPIFRDAISQHVIKTEALEHLLNIPIQFFDKDTCSTIVGIFLRHRHNNGLFKYAKRGFLVKLDAAGYVKLAGHASPEVLDIYVRSLSQSQCEDILPLAQLDLAVTLVERLHYLGITSPRNDLLSNCITNIQSTRLAPVLRLIQLEPYTLPPEICSHLSTLDDDLAVQILATQAKTCADITPLLPRSDLATCRVMASNMSPDEKEAFEGNYTMLSVFVEQHKEGRRSYLSHAFDDACYDHSAEATDFIKVYAVRLGRSMTTTNTDHLLAGMIGRDLEAICSVLRAIFEHAAHTLHDRYHCVVMLFQHLVALCKQSEDAEKVVRLFTTFLANVRGSSAEKVNKALAKHLPWLLTEYVTHCISPAANMTASCKTMLEEGICYEIMHICSTSEREMIGSALDSGRRAVFKRLYDDWNKFGRWKDK